MNAEQLKGAILQKAISGRLVPQLEEEPAVEQIGEVPEAIPFAIPRKWKWIKIKNIFHFQAGKFIQGKDIKKNSFKGSFPCYGGNGIRGYVKIKNREGTFPIIGRQGALCGNVNMATGEFYATEHAVVVDVKKYGDPYCIGLFLEAMNLNQYKTATAQPGLSVKKIIELYFPLPPLSEQRRIVAKINELMPLVDEYGKAQEKLDNLNAELPDKLKASLLQEAISGKLVPQLDEEPAVEQIGEMPEEIPFDIPKKWKWVRLSNVGKIIGGGTPKTNIPEYWENGTIPWITPADLGKQNSWKISRGKKNISKLGYEKSSAKLLPAGTVIFSSRAPIGYAAIAQCDCTTNQGCKSFVPNKAVITSEWGYFSMIWATPNMKSRASEMTFKEISGKGVGETWIPLPPVQEQLRIVNKLSKILSIIDLQNIK